MSHPTPSTRRRSRRAHARTLGAAAAGLALAACAGTRPDPVVELSNTTMAPTMATVQEITRNASQWNGRMLITSGEVNRVFGPRWFSIGGGDFEGGGELLVVGPSTAPGILSTLADSGAVMNDIIQVRGTLRLFEEDDIEREIGVDLDGDVFDGWDGKPVLVMTDMDLTPRVDVVPAVAVPVPVPVAPITEHTMIVDAPDRSALVGDIAALLGVRVHSVLSQRAFLVGPTADKQLLVVTDQAMPGIEPGQTVAVAGVIKALPSDLASVRAEWGLTTTNEAMLRLAGIYLDADAVEITARTAR